jgi:hypothetical protein
MARNIRSAQLETRTARLKLEIRKKPYMVRVAPGVRLGYRRNAAAGTWSVIAADGKSGNWVKKFGLADDHEEAWRTGPDLLGGAVASAQIGPWRQERRTDGRSGPTGHSR